MVELNAIETINKACSRKLRFFNSKSVKNILGGLFYLIGYKVSSPRKQRSIADALGTTEITVRISYKKWLDEFPDLFLDVIGRFVSENSPRCLELLSAMDETYRTSRKLLVSGYSR